MNKNYLLHRTSALEKPGDGVLAGIPVPQRGGGEADLAGEGGEGDGGPDLFGNQIREDDEAPRIFLDII